MIDHLTKATAIRNTVKRAVSGGWVQQVAVQDCTAWLERSEKTPANRKAIEEFVRAEYTANGLDYRGKKAE